MKLLLSTSKILYIYIYTYIHILFIWSHLVQSINKNWYCISLFIRSIFLESSFERARLQHQNNSWGSGICRNLCSTGALIQLPMRANLVDGGKQIAPGILGQCWTGCVFVDNLAVFVAAVVISFSWILLLHGSFYKWNHLYGRCSMLEKRGIFGIAMLDSQRCILGEVVPLGPSQEWLSWRLKVATPKSNAACDDVCFDYCWEEGTIQLITYTPGFVSSMLGNKVKDLIPNVGFSWWFTTYHGIPNPYQNHPQNLAAKYVKDSIPFPTGEGCLSPAGTGISSCLYQVDVE